MATSFTHTNPYFVPTAVDTVALSTSLAEYRKVLIDNAYNDVVMFKLANEAGNKKLVDGGGSIVEILIRNRQNNGGFYLGADVLNNTQGDDLAQVEYRWQNCYEPVTITRDEERINSGSAHKLIDLVGTKVSLSERAIKDRLDQALSQPVGDADKLIDLETLVNTGTLGSIAGGTFTFWQSTVTASGAFATQGLTDMTTGYYTVSSSQSVDNPTHFLTTDTIFKKFEQTRLPLERISNTATSANAGFTNLTFKNRPVIYGNYIQAGLLFGLNMNYISLNVDTETDMTTTQFITPTNQTVKVAQILWRGNMTTNNRRRHFKLTGIS
jgi:hypothetical protein